MKLKTCKACKQKFEPIRPLQQVCSVSCSYNYQKKAFEKKMQKEKVEKKKELMTLSDWLKIAQTTFNAYIRKRDALQNCISCNKPLRPGNIDCGHYYSSGGHYNLRFNEDNCHAQCSRPCNKDKAGDLINYRLGLINRIGQERLTQLEALSQITRKFTIDEVKEINQIYKLKIKEL
jgi:hypothetical protein